MSKADHKSESRATLEASFEVPGSDQKYVITLPVRDGKMQYAFETQPLHDVKKDTPHKARLRLLEANTGKELASLEQEFRSTTDQSSLPTKAPLQGIAYFPPRNSYSTRTAVPAAVTISMLPLVPTVS
jgi:hypothetical protein